MGLNDFQLLNQVPIDGFVLHYRGALLSKFLLNRIWLDFVVSIQKPVKCFLGNEYSSSYSDVGDFATPYCLVGTATGEIK